MHAADTTHNSSMDTLEPDGLEPERIADEEKQEPQSEDDFLVHWDGDDDPLNPRRFSLVRRWYMVSVISLGSLLV